MIQSAGIVVIDWKNEEPTVLCVRAYSNWDFPKGQVEPNESLIEAAARELLEETDISVGSDVRLAGITAPSVTYGSGKKSKTATYFLADRISDKEPYLPINPELGKPENDEYRWVPVSHIDNLLPSRLLPVMTFIEDWVHDNEKT
jgi:bis(5'-nucleosidyl)-tetraphosphatase|tara:strand:- start:1484 stop:1918 length:435 start_codon:yes stop_codon:yes gene_type:complete